MQTIIINGDEISLKAVIIVDAIVTGDVHPFYVARFGGGQHVSIKESTKPRADFIAEWKSANV